MMIVAFLAGMAVGHLMLGKIKEKAVALFYKMKAFLML